MNARALDLYHGEQRLAAAHAAINEREDILISRERANKEREDVFAQFEEYMLRKLEEDYHGIVATVEQIRSAMANAKRILTRRREQVLSHENFSDSLKGVYGQGWFSPAVYSGLETDMVLQEDTQAALLSTECLEPSEVSTRVSPRDLSASSRWSCTTVGTMMIMDL
jgi:hypothetical protein